MKLSMKSQPHFDVLKYSGTHSCRDDDHEQDQQVHEYLKGRVGTGASRFLADVRELQVRFHSGLADVWNSWAPARKGNIRLAVLWNPSPKNPDRWSNLSRSFGVGRTGPRLWEMFVDEDEARAFLLAGEWEATKGDPSP